MRSIEHHTHGVQNVLGAINMVLVRRIGRETVLLHHHRSGNGQGARHGKSVTNARRRAGESRRSLYIAAFGAAQMICPNRGGCHEIVRKIESGEIKGLLSICFNHGLAAGQQLCAGATGKARLLRGD